MKRFVIISLAVMFVAWIGYRAGHVPIQSLRNAKHPRATCFKPGPEPWCKGIKRDCSYIVREYLHQGGETYMTAAKWIELMDRVDICEHPEERTFYGFGVGSDGNKTQFRH